MYANSTSASLNGKVAMVAVALMTLFLAGATQAQVSERNFRFATANQAGHPIVVGAEKWAELVKQKSNGKMQIKLFPGGVLGGDVQVLSAVQGGVIDFASMNSGILQGQVKEFAILDLPFMFNNGPEADAILDGAFGKKLASLLPPKDLVNLAYFDFGFRNLTNNKRPVAKLEDFSGLKLRVIQSPIYIDTFSALGTNTVPMPVTEVYTALEQKIIDGQENPFSVILTFKFNEVQKYLSVTNHIYNAQSLLASKKTMDKLSKEEQEILQSAADEAKLYQRTLTRDSADKTLAELKRTMTVNVVSQEELVRIRAKLQPIIDKYSSNIGHEVVKELQTALEKGRAANK